jgi:hypothetical protein
MFTVNRKAEKLKRTGLGPNNQNTLKNPLNFRQIFRWLKLLTNISD